ncbi:ABC transporter ATP-binding protein [Oscillospiraceae bacterium NSJ-54]|uniref:ABC transporter ATP-binding protein n=2 Tax=Zongyangia hominis TaxID=2763677 RepID=A0A926EAA5_9FIRM|nr:ABC transporter ATP-binding protein [Zongyangia hominis]
MVCAFFIAAIDLLFPLVSKGAMEQLLPQRLFGTFFLVMGAVALAFVLRSVMFYIVTFLGHQLGVYIEADMRQDLFSHLQTLSFRFYDQNRTGHLMSRVTNDLFEITELAHHGPEDLFISLITLIGSFIVMFTIQWKLALVVFFMIPLIVFFATSQKRRMADASLKVKKRVADVNADLESSLSGMRVAKAFSNEKYEIRKFSKGNDRFKNSKGEFYKAMGIFNAGMEFLTAMLNVLVIAVGGFFIMRGSLTFTELITFNLYIAVFLQPIKRLTSFMEQFTTGMAGFGRFTELMDIEPDVKEAPDAKVLADVRGDVAFEDLSFSYDGEHNVLEHVSLSLGAGETLAVVGPSGSGKTTLCQLLPRFYDPTGGRILIDGQDIKELTLHSLRDAVGIVQQDVFLFAGTIAQNIRYGRSSATMDEVVQAAMLADIHKEIMALPDGYDTYVGERGILLSGGQKQRISIARIFLKNPPILILDEATSALDSETESRIQQAFDRLSQGRTTLIIAHRLSTIKNANRIVVIDNEGIAELGTHEELMQKDGRYAALYRTQFGQSPKEE